MNTLMLSALEPSQTGSAWPPILVGVLIGLLTTATLLIANRMFGASSAYATLAGAIGERVARRHTRSLKYYCENPPKLNWEVVLVAGVILGGFLAAWTGAEWTGRLQAPMWVERFGDAPWLRAGAAFLGGCLMAFGARLAGGCTSGHGISGALQLGVGSWIALICFFAGGAAVAFPLYRW